MLIYSLHSQLISRSMSASRTPVHGSVWVFIAAILKIKDCDELSESSVVEETLANKEQMPP